MKFVKKFSLIFGGSVAGMFCASVLAYISILNYGSYILLALLVCLFVYFTILASRTTKWYIALTADFLPALIGVCLTGALLWGCGKLILNYLDASAAVGFTIVFGTVVLSAICVAIFAMILFLEFLYYLIVTLFTFSKKITQKMLSHFATTVIATACGILMFSTLYYILYPMCFQ